MKSRPRKIFFCIGVMGRGGAERVVANLANYFVKNNDVSIIVTRDDKVGYKLDKRIGYFVLDGANRKGSGLLKRTISRIISMRRIIKRELPDVVISFSPEPSFRLLVSKAFLHVRAIISVRNDPDEEYKGFFRRLLVKILFVKADGFVFQTLDAQKWFSKRIQRKSLVIPNPINKEFLRKPYGGKREKRIVTVGRLTEQKNQKLLIDAFSKFYENNSEFKLEIYGDGPLRNKLYTYINDSGLTDAVTLMGETPNIGNKIYKASMFVFTSDYEGMPNALMEAMALGLPCISTDCPIGGPRFLIKDNFSGMLVKVGDISGVLSAMMRIANDREFASMISSNASYAMVKLDPSIINEKWHRLIDAVINDDKIEEKVGF